MKYIVHGHRNGEFLFANNPRYKELWAEIASALSAVTDDMIMKHFDTMNRQAKSISQSVNTLLKNEFVNRGWHPESYIFADDEYAKQQKGTWRLDFAKELLSVEVGFNHRSDISWNLLKPTLASELNHVQKAIQTEGGIIIAATEDMKRAGGFDSAVGTYEDYVQYLKPLRNVLSAPMAIIGLEAPKTFEIVVWEDDNNKKRGKVQQRL